MLRSCVRCSYSLRGLPANHACPECGLAFDEESRIWLAPRSKFRLALALFSLYLFFHAFGGFYSSGSSMKLGELVYGSIFAVWGLAGFVYLWRVHRKPFFAAALPDGLYLRVEQPKTECIPWSNVAGALNDATSAGALIILKGERLRDVTGVFRNQADAEDFVEEVERRIREM